MAQIQKLSYQAKEQNWLYGLSDFLFFIFFSISSVRILQHTDKETQQIFTTQTCSFVAHGRDTWAVGDCIWRQGVELIWTITKSNSFFL